MDGFGSPTFFSVLLKTSLTFLMKMKQNRALKVHRAALTATNTAWQKIWEKASPLSTLTALGDLNNKKRWASEQTG